MTRKDFELIARILLHSKPVIPPFAELGNYTIGKQEQWENTVEHFAEMLGATNPRFDKARFIAACKGE
jgi:hypothetical protein